MCKKPGGFSQKIIKRFRIVMCASLKIGVVSPLKNGDPRKVRSNELRLLKKKGVRRNTNPE